MLIVPYPSMRARLRHCFDASGMKETCPPFTTPAVTVAEGVTVGNHHGEVAATVSVE
jgi:hypothetical protein